MGDDALGGDVAVGDVTLPPAFTTSGVADDFLRFLGTLTTANASIKPLLSKTSTAVEITRSHSRALNDRTQTPHNDPIFIAASSGMGQNTLLQYAKHTLLWYSAQ